MVYTFHANISTIAGYIQPSIKLLPSYSEAKQYAHSNWTVAKYTINVGTMREKYAYVGRTRAGIVDVEFGNWDRENGVLTIVEK